jgi:O-antigen ligase
VGTLCLLFISGIFFKQNQAYNKTVYNKIIIAKNLILNKGELDDNSKRSRIGIYEAALNIYKKNPVFGVGVGDVNDELRAEYISLGFEHFYKEKIYNSHNQYLHFALLGGVIGFLIFVSCLGYNLYFAIHNKDFLYMSFLLVFIIVILTENFLNRIHGIFFFAIFNSIFHYRSKYN